MLLKKIFSATAVVLLTCNLTSAQTIRPNINALLTPKLMSEIREWAINDIVTISINAQNKRLNNLDQAAIDKLDKQWRAERESEDKPLIAATLSNPLSSYLTRIQAQSLGLYFEIFVMDQNGLNVGQSSITSDFWQGDEDKFQKTFSVSSDAVFVDEPEWDEGAGVWRGQVSFTLADKESSAAIGSITIELNLTELERRSTI